MPSTIVIPTGGPPRAHIDSATFSGWIAPN